MDDKKIINKEKIVTAAKKVSLSPSSIAKKGSSQMRGFMDFIRTQGAIGLGDWFSVGWSSWNDGKIAD